jgi:hypothetical protein
MKKEKAARLAASFQGSSRPPIDDNKYLTNPNSLRKLKGTRTVRAALNESISSNDHHIRGCYMYPTNSLGTLNARSKIIPIGSWQTGRDDSHGLPVQSINSVPCACRPRSTTATLVTKLEINKSYSYKNLKLIGYSALDWRGLVRVS